MLSLSGLLSSNVFFFIPQKFERRGHFITEDEKAKWEQIHPTMMSEEEEVDGKFKVCQQEWRSDTFNDFMERLDERASNSSRKRPRCERYLGTPVKMDPPAKAKEWMVEGRATMPILAPNSPELV